MQPLLKGRGYSGGDGLTANGIAQTGKQRTENRQSGKMPGFQGLAAPMAARRDGRKTVGKILSPRHEKFLSVLETSRRQPVFYRTAQSTTQSKESAMSNPLHSSDHSDPAQPVSRLGESLVQTAESQRVLVQELTTFTKDEGLRFVNLRMERNGAALDRLQDCQGIPGLLGVQQEWLRDFVQDYAGQNARLMGAWRGLTRDMMATSAETASDTVDRMQDDVRAHQADDVVNHAENMGHQNMDYQGVQQADQTADIGQNANTYIQH